jgi:hypothetical protein
MKNSRILLAALGGLLVLTAGVAPAKPPTEWDGLVRVPSKRLSLVYLQPGADFRSYTKVMLDPTEVAFQKNWRRDYNSTRRDLSGRVSDSDVQEAVTEGIQKSSDIFAAAWGKGGYPIVNAPGPDVLRVRTAILNISIAAPDMQTAGRSHTFSDSAGHAQLVVEVRDSLTGALLGRAVDSKIAGDNSTAWRTSVSNRGDFRVLVEDWANVSVKGLAELKALSPIAP